MYGDGMCPQTSFLIPSPRNTWPARSIGQGNAIIYQFALALFSLPNILLMKNESFHHGTATAKQSQRLSCRWDRFCTCGALWQHTAPSGLPGSSVAWLMNPHGRKFESRCLAKHWSWILLLGFIYPPIPESFCWAFQNLGQIDNAWAFALPSTLQACCFMDKQAAHTSFVSSTRPMIPTLEPVSVDRLIPILFLFPFPLPSLCQKQETAQVFENKKSL